MNILQKIIQTKEKELLNFTPDYIKFLEKEIVKRDNIRDFKSTLKKEGINIIAEIKKASPSKGVIRKDFDPAKIARIYQENGASAISVLTDKTYFQGDIEFLKLVRKITDIPILRKDFIIHKYQILEAYAYGADTFLLIVKALSKDKLKELLDYGREFGMEALVEIHSKQEADIALEAGAKIIGINNRDLETFKVDINLSKKLSPYLKERGAEVVVAESGISSYQQILELKNYDVDAFLIGESLMKETDIAKKLSQLLGESYETKSR